MKKYQYHVYVETDTKRVCVETNDINEAISVFMHNAELGHYTYVVDGITGEIYVTANIEDSWCTAEWALMINGWLMERFWG